MGCGASASASDVTRNVERKKQKISVRMAPNVADFIPERHRIILVFGGPGSKKGRVVDDLVTSFGLKFISLEEVIMQELPKKLANIMSLNTPAEIKAAIKEDPSRVEIGWVLERLSSRLEAANHNEDYLIDVVPNFKTLLQSDSFAADCANAFAQFEKMHRISFALNLAIPADKVLAAKQTYCANPKGTSMKESGGKGDEMDTGRTQRRAALYEKASKPFLEYFQDSSRLVTVDVTCGDADLIWNKVLEILLDLRLGTQRRVNTILVFSQDNNEVATLKRSGHETEEIRLSDILPEIEEIPIDKIAAALSKEINARSKSVDAYVVMINGTILENIKTSEINNADNNCEKPIVYEEPDTGQIEVYIPGFAKSSQKKNGGNFFAFSSLENEICLYTKAMDVNVCKSFTSLIAVNRTV